MNPPCPLHGFHLAPTEGMQISLKPELWDRQEGLCSLRIQTGLGLSLLKFPVLSTTPHGLGARSRWRN